MPGDRSTNHVALAGEFFVLSEMALRRLDAAPTLGHTKAIDILLLNRETDGHFCVEVKATENIPRHDRLFGFNYCWTMSERHGKVAAANLVYCFVALGTPLDREKPRLFIVPAVDVAEYILWNHEVWRTHPSRTRGKAGSTLRVFRIPARPSQAEEVPPSWQDGRWERWENNWEVFGLAAASR